MAALVFLAAILIIQGKYMVKTHALDSVIMRRYAKKLPASRRRSAGRCAGLYRTKVKTKEFERKD